MFTKPLICKIYIHYMSEKCDDTCSCIAVYVNVYRVLHVYEGFRSKKAIHRYHLVQTSYTISSNMLLPPCKHRHIPYKQLVFVSYTLRTNTTHYHISTPHFKNGNYPETSYKYIYILNIYSTYIIGIQDYILNTFDFLEFRILLVLVLLLLLLLPLFAFTVSQKLLH